MKSLSEYGADLREARPASTAAFVCPICLHEFELGTTNSGLIAKAHVFPKAVGRTYKTRACKACDQRIGDRVEGPVVNYLRSLRVVSGLAAGDTSCATKTKMRIGNLSVSVHVKFENGKWTVVAPKWGAFDDLPALFGVELPKEVPAQVPFRHPPPPIEITVDPGRHDVAGLAMVLALKIAFYTAFEHYGYGYVLRSDLDWVRSVLTSCSGASAPCVHSVQLRNNPFAPAGDYPGTYLYDSEMNGLRGLFCISGFWDIGLLTVLPPLDGATDDWLKTCDLGWREAARVTFPDHVIRLLRDSVKNRPGGRERGAVSGMA